MWSHPGGGEFASGNIWQDIWNCQQSLTRSFFFPFSCLIFRLLAVLSHFVALEFFCTFLLIWFCYSPSWSLRDSTICSTSFIFCLFVMSLFWFLSPSLSHHLFLSAVFLFFPTSQNISFFSPPPLWQTLFTDFFRDFPGDCKQASPMLCRHESMLKLQLWKKHSRNPAKKKRAINELKIYCAAHHHAVPMRRSPEPKHN